MINLSCATSLRTGSHVEQGGSAVVTEGLCIFMSLSPIPGRRALQTRKAVSPLGEKMIKLGLLSEDQYHTAIKEQRRTKRALGDVLQDITGKQVSPELLQEFKIQQLFELKILYGVQSFDVDREVLDKDQVVKLVDGLMPLEVCTRYQVVPVRQVDNTAVVAMVDPEDLQALDDISRRLRAKGLTLQRIVITPEDYQRVISNYLDTQASELASLSPEEDTGTADMDKLYDSLDVGDDLQEVVDEEGADLGQLSRAAEDAPIIKLSNTILLKAIDQGVSDIHIEPQEDTMRIRFRRDGVLQEAFDPLPKRIIPALVSRFKIMSELDIAERRQPQDGRIRRNYMGRSIDFRVSTLPSRFGEKIVLRILDNSNTKLGLDQLITDQATLDSFREMIAKPYGMILVTGPTGSGKTTSLYSALAERNTPDVNITTAEDPVEYTLPGITQVQVIREKGMDFARILRAFLRQDPDIMLVGETRDLETAKTAVEAALTGHLVLTTLHTNDAPGAIARLAEMGVEPFMLSSSLIGILAQRLLRKVCSGCRMPYTPSEERLHAFGLMTSRVSSITFYRAQSLSNQEIDECKRTGQSVCSTCNGAGYKGRIGVYELLRLSDKLRDLINREAPTDMLREVAIEEGMKTLLTYSLQLVIEGRTTLEEVERVTLSDSGLEAAQKGNTTLVCRTCFASLHPEWLDCPYCTTPRIAT